MKRYLITLDTGTTNTRAVLWQAGSGAVALEREEAGVRDTAACGDSSRLKEGIRACLRRLTKRIGCGWDEVEAVFASGMISSDVGLLEVPHLTAPAGREDFASTMKRAFFPEICPVPFYFIRGMKNCQEGSGRELEMDVMRGEETEALALLRRLPPGKPYLLILPGSHTKFIRVSPEGRFLWCHTSLAGELLEALTRHTILADAVERQFVTKEGYCREAAAAGYQAAKREGLPKAAFQTRLYRRFCGRSRDWAASFLLGAVLQGDAAAVKSCLEKEGTRLFENAGDGAQDWGQSSAYPEVCAVIAGKEPFLSGLYDVLIESGELERVEKYEPDSEIPLSAQGARELAGIFLEKQEKRRGIE